MNKFRYAALLLFTLPLLFGSCYEYPYSADLQVTVKGFLSGNPRQGLLVQVFATREEAEQLYYPLSPVVETNEWGEVFIFGLDPGEKYFLRIDGFIQTRIKRTDKLRNGTNDCVIRLL